MSAALTLYSGHVCPYAQRVVIVAAEKGIALEKIMVDMANKPEWFVTISPNGKIPVLKVGDAVLFESIVIAEYVSEASGTSLHPIDPLERARHRAWMEFANTIHAATMGMIVATEAAPFDKSVSEVVRKLDQLEAVIVGPYFSGPDFCLVDAIYAPLFRGLAIYEGIGKFGFFDTRPKLAAWREALAARPTVIGAVAPDFRERTLAVLGMRETYLKSLMLQAA